MKLCEIWKSNANKRLLSSDKVPQVSLHKKIKTPNKITFFATSLKLFEIKKRSLSGTSLTPALQLLYRNLPCWKHASQHIDVHKVSIFFSSFFFLWHPNSRLHLRCAFVFPMLSRVLLNDLPCFPCVLKVRPTPSSWSLDSVKEGAPSFSDSVGKLLCPPVPPRLPYSGKLSDRGKSPDEEWY